MRWWFSSTFAAVAMAAASPSFAARDFTPQSGTWIVSQEKDGKPGRGLAIDVKGNTFFMQVFAYEKNGDATFYTATGQMNGNSVTAPLMRYQGGRSFGSAARDAVEDRSLGDVTVDFSNGLKGTVRFPGEDALAIERFLVTSTEPGVTNPLKQKGARGLVLYVLDEQGQVAAPWSAEFEAGEGQSVNLTLINAVAQSFQDLLCQPVGVGVRFDCKPADTPPYLDNESKPVVAPKVARLVFELAGRDLSGSVYLGDNASIPMQVRGWNTGAEEDSPFRHEPRGLVRTRVSQDYGAVSVYGESCSLICEYTERYNTLMPYNGTWIVQDELTGKPGRGLALDIQGSTAILQVFNYRADGQPTFHMGSAAYLSKGLDTLASVTTIPMDEYQAGRSIGGAAQSASLRSHAGNAMLEFSQKKVEGRPKDEAMWWQSGQVQLPGESPVRIKRLQLEAPSSAAEAFLGQWCVPDVYATVTLDRIVGDAAMSQDGKDYCQPSEMSPSVAYCQLGGWSRYVDWQAGETREGMVRLRDRHGNAVGLGRLD